MVVGTDPNTFFLIQPCCWGTEICYLNCIDIQRKSGTVLMSTQLLHICKSDQAKKSSRLMVRSVTKSGRRGWTCATHFVKQPALKKTRHLNVPHNFSATLVHLKHYLFLIFSVSLVQDGCPLTKYKIGLQDETLQEDWVGMKKKLWGGNLYEGHVSSLFEPHSYIILSFVCHKTGFYYIWMNVSFSEQVHCWTTSATCDTKRIFPGHWPNCLWSIWKVPQGDIPLKHCQWSVIHGSHKNDIKWRRKDKDVWWKQIEALEDFTSRTEKELEGRRVATMAVKMESYSLMDSALHPGINLSNYRQLSLFAISKKVLGSNRALSLF